MARKPSTYYQRRAARQRSATRPACIGLGLLFLAGSGSLAALVIAAGLEALAGNLASTVAPATVAYTLAMGALFAFGCAVIGALALWEGNYIFDSPISPG